MEPQEGGIAMRIKRLSFPIHLKFTRLQNESIKTQITENMLDRDLKLKTYRIKINAEIEAIE